MWLNLLEKETQGDAYGWWVGHKAGFKHRALQLRVYPCPELRRCREWECGRISLQVRPGTAHKKQSRPGGWRADPDVMRRRMEMDTESCRGYQHVDVTAFQTLNFVNFRATSNFRQRLVKSHIWCHSRWSMLLVELRSFWVPVGRGGRSNLQDVLNIIARTLRGPAKAGW